LFASVDACTNLIVTPGASEDGSTIYSYAADAASLYGSLDRQRARENIPKGTMRQIFDWDSGKYLGEIPEAPQTYDVVGNMNEFQLTIGETTFGGLASLAGPQPTARMDYGSLIWTTLTRAKTVQEALKVMTELVKDYGYYSEGESFTLTDPTEAWVLEMIGKGADGFGAVWAAQKVPDGHMCAHANQARIRYIFQEPKDTVFYSDDVVTFAIQKGLYSPAKSGDYSDFSFSDVYDPLTFVGSRSGEARVWSIFSKVTPEEMNFQEKYYGYAFGKDLKNRMPFSVPVKKKLKVQDLMNFMRDKHYNTPLNMTSDVGAGTWQNAFRDRPLTWSFKNETYVNERTVGTQQTGWHFVANMRKHLPNHVGGVFWFGVDDATFSVHIPFYPYAEVPSALACCDNGDVNEFSFDSLFWLNNLVANRVYAQWETLFPIVNGKVQALETAFIDRQKGLEEGVLKNFGADITSAAVYLSRESQARTDLVMKTWDGLWKYLTVTFRDGVKVLTAKPGRSHGTSGKQGGPVAVVVEGNGVGSGEWPEAWKKRVVESTGDHFKVVGGGGGTPDVDHPRTGRERSGTLKGSDRSENEWRKVQVMTEKGRRSGASASSSAFHERSGVTASLTSDNTVQYI
jgi:dipeptidase